MTNEQVMSPAINPVQNGEAFGRLAASYDQDFESLPASRRIREIIWNVYLQYFKPQDSLLELNCGTGTDAMALAAQGIRVHATDISEAMLDAFQKKLSLSPLRDIISTERLAFDQLPKLHGRLFDGAYSNMGGLNCESDLHRVAKDLHSLLKPGAVFVGTFLGDVAIWDMLAFLARGDVRRAFRRWTSTGVAASVAGAIVQTFYYSPRSIARLFSPHFQMVDILGVNIFTPPPTSQQAYRRLGKGMQLLEKLDDVVMHRPPFNRIGDHVVLVLKHN